MAMAMAVTMADSLVEATGTMAEEEEDLAAAMTGEVEVEDADASIIFFKDMNYEGQ